MLERSLINDTDGWVLVNVYEPLPSVSVVLYGVIYNYPKMLMIFLPILIYLHLRNSLTNNHSKGNAQNVKKMETEKNRGKDTTWNSLTQDVCKQFISFLILIEIDQI